jgi:hypothetical protein
MGFFSQKPSRPEQAKMLAVSQKVMPLFTCLGTNGSVKFSDGQIVDFNNREQCDHVLSAVQVVVENLRLGDLPPYTIHAINDRARLVHDLINESTYEQIGPIKETAQGIVEGINVHEMFCFNYYELYPRFEPLREMIDNGVKVIVPALDPIFVEALPDFIKLAFPRFSEHFSKMHRGSDGAA